MLNVYKRAEVTFEFVKEIGHEGKNSRVYTARDHNLDAELAIKQISKSSIGDPTEYFRESRVLYQSGHPNVVPVFYACEDDANIYIAIPYYTNGSLRSLMATRYLTVREIIVYACQFISALHNIHSKKLIHFDVKPDNILLSDRNEALLSDFGLAKPTNLTGVAGQDQWYQKQRPPESLDSDQFTNQFDIYQVGVTLYRMCNGDAMFNAQFSAYGDADTFDRDAFRYDVKNGNFPDRSSFLPHIPERLRRIVKKCLATEPDSRYKSAIEISNDLAAIDGAELDWQYTESSGKKEWVKNSAGRQFRLGVDESGNAVAVKKTAAGNETRVRDYCIESISDSKIKEFLRNH